ncbi:MAG: hypothetical protein WC356_07480 [Candidatus Micrarchaeia archaeon]
MDNLVRMLAFQANDPGSNESLFLFKEKGLHPKKKLKLGYENPGGRITFSFFFKKERKA